MTTQQFAMLFVQCWGSFNIHSFDETAVMGEVETLDRDHCQKCIKQWAESRGIGHKVTVIHNYYKRGNNGETVYVMGVSYWPNT